MSLSLITLNVQMNKHWDRILPYLAKMDADVLCLQEIFERDLEKIERLGYSTMYAFTCNMLYDTNDPSSIASRGVCVASKLPLKNAHVLPYYEAEHPHKLQPQGDDEKGKRKTTTHSLAFAEVHKEGVCYPVTTTHFTWSPNGRSTRFQKEDMTALLHTLHKYPSLIFTGDLNIPRGFNVQYARLLSHYHDWIPKEYASSIDLAYHRNGNDPVQGPNLAKYMVDYIFTTSDFNVRNVSQKYGISDHTAFSADIEKAT